MAETFATLIAEIRVDDVNLKADLRKDERVIRDSANRMNASLASVSIAAGSAAGTGFDASRALGALSASAGALGGSLGGVVGQISATIVSIQALGAAAGITQVAILGPVGLVLGLFAFREEIVAGIDKMAVWQGWMADMGRLAKETAREFEAFKASADFTERLAIAQDKLAVARGDISQENLRRRELLRGSATLLPSQADQLIGLELETKAADAFNAAERASDARIAALRQEHDLLTGKITLAETIKDLDERALFVGNKKIKDAEALFQIDKQRILGDLARFREEERVQAATNRGVAQSLAISAGINQPSDFVSDPTQRHLMQLMERLASAEQPGGFGGSIGQKVVSNVANITARPFGEQRVSTERQQEKQTGLLSEIKWALDGLSFGAAP